MGIARRSRGTRTFVRRGGYEPDNFKQKSPYIFIGAFLVAGILEKSNLFLEDYYKIIDYSNNHFTINKFDTNSQTFKKEKTLLINLVQM